MPPKAHNALQVQASIEIAELKSDFEDMSCAYLRHHSMSDNFTLQFVGNCADLTTHSRVKISQPDICGHMRREMDGFTSQICRSVANFSKIVLSHFLDVK
jgi:hypothetical protein